MKMDLIHCKMVACSADLSGTTTEARLDLSSDQMRYCGLAAYSSVVRLLQAICMCSRSSWVMISSPC